MWITESDLGSAPLLARTSLPGKTDWRPGRVGAAPVQRWRAGSRWSSPRPADPSSPAWQSVYRGNPNICERAVTVAMCRLSQGAMLSWPAAVVPQLEHSWSPAAQSWLASSSFLGSMAGCLLAAVALQCKGKQCNAFSQCPSRLIFVCVFFFFLSVNVRETKLDQDKSNPTQP